MSLREGAIVWSYLAGVAEIEAKGLWISLDENSPCASKTQVLVCWSWATGFRGLLTTSAKLCKASMLQTSARDTVSSRRSRQTQAGSGWPRYAPVHHWALDVPATAASEMTQPLPRPPGSPYADLRSCAFSCPTPLVLAASLSHGAGGRDHPLSQPGSQWPTY